MIIIMLQFTVTIFFDFTLRNYFYYKIRFPKKKVTVPFNYIYKINNRK